MTYMRTLIGSFLKFLFLKSNYKGLGINFPISTLYFPLFSHIFCSVVFLIPGSLKSPSFYNHMGSFLNSWSLSTLLPPEYTYLKIRRYDIHIG